MKIIPLSEGSFTIDKTKQFIPFNKEVDDLQARPTGSLLVEVQPFVVITDEDVILLDTGLGFVLPNGQLQIHANLAQHGINSTDVTKVLMSHLHKDHAGGLSFEDPATGMKKLSFPKATHYVQAKEFEFAMDVQNKSYIQDDFALLQDHPALHLFKEGDEIGTGIRHVLTGAHCPYHTVYHLENDTSHVFFGGDVAPQLQQMKSRFVAKYDFDGKLAMELRQQWWQEGNKEHWTFLFYHDIKSAMVAC